MNQTTFPQAAMLAILTMIAAIGCNEQTPQGPDPAGQAREQYRAMRQRWEPFDGLVGQAYLHAKQGEYDKAKEIFKRFAPAREDAQDNADQAAADNVDPQNELTDAIFAEDGLEAATLTLDEVIAASTDSTRKDALDLLGGHLLWLAAKRDDLPSVKTLVEAGVDVNTAPIYEWTALHEAAGNGSVEMIRFLLDHGARIDPTAKEGMTPLWVAVNKYAPLPAVQLLIERGADVNVRNSFGVTLLENATLMKNPEMVALLEKAGATK